MIHGDVFRPPVMLNLFTAFLGAGAQIFATLFFLLACVLLGVFKATRRGALLTALIVIYALCGLAGGFVSSRIYKQLKGKNWVWNTVLTAAVFPLPLSLVFTWVNSVAWGRASTAALPATTILVRYHEKCFTEHVWKILDYNVLCASCCISCWYIAHLLEKKKERTILMYLCISIYHSLLVDSCHHILCTFPLYGIGCNRGKKYHS
jgi:hypothetical protein